MRGLFSTLAAYLILSGAFSSWPALGVIRLASQPVAASVSSLLFGHNTVWARGGLGLWNNRQARVNEVVMPLVEELRPGLLRFPGGTRALRYHFSETIGPVKYRKPQCDPFKGTYDATTYGLDEFLRLAERLHSESILVTPLSDGTPEEAAALIAYVNATPDSHIPLGKDRNGTDWGTSGDWAKRRAENGHPAPYRVRYVEIGNEPYLNLASGPNFICDRQGRFRQNERWENGHLLPITARDYAEQVELTGTLIHRVDPGVRVGASAYSRYDFSDTREAVAHHDTRDEWNRRLVLDAGNAFDFFVLHPYRFLSRPVESGLPQALRKTIRDLRELDANKAIGITEFGSLLYGGTLEDALLTAEVLRVAVEEHVLLCLRHILIEDNPKGLFARSAAILGPDYEKGPGYYAEAWLRSAIQGTVFPLETDDPHLTGFATRRARTLSLVLVSDRPFAAGRFHRVSVALPSGQWNGQAHLIWSAGLTTPWSRTRRERRVVKGSGELSLDLPLNSLAVITLHAKD